MFVVGGPLYQPYPSNFRMFSDPQVGEGLPYYSVKLLLDYLNVCDHPTTLQTDRLMDGRTDDILISHSNTAQCTYVLRAVITSAFNREIFVNRLIEQNFD